MRGETVEQGEASEMLELEKQWTQLRFLRALEGILEDGSDT